MFTYATVKLSRTAEEFTPDDRFDSHPPEMSTSPSTIPIEFAMYVIPDRPTFDTTPLCAQITIPNTVAPAFTSYGWDHWQVAADRRLNVTGCSGGLPSADLLASCVTVASQEALQDFNLHCIEEMAPSYLFDFNVTLPVNNKWLYAANNSVSGINQVSHNTTTPPVTHSHKAVSTALLTAAPFSSSAALVADSFANCSVCDCLSAVYPCCVSCLPARV